MLLQPAAKVSAGHALHRHPAQDGAGSVDYGPGRKDRDNVCTTELRQNQRLLLETGQVLIVSRALVPEQLDRGRPVEAQLRGQVNLAHPSGRELAIDAKIVAQQKPLVVHTSRSDG